MMAHRVQMVGRSRRHVEYIIPRRLRGKRRSGGGGAQRRRRRGEAVHWGGLQQKNPNKSRMQHRHYEHNLTVGQDMEFYE